MGFTSIKVNSLEVGVGDYAVDSKGLSALESLYRVEPQLAEMAGDHPHLTGWVPTEKSFTLEIFFLATTVDDRETLYDALVAEVEPDRYVAIEWTRNAVTKTLMVVVGEAVVEPRYTEAALACVAPDPVPV